MIHFSNIRKRLLRPEIAVICFWNLPLFAQCIGFGSGGASIFKRSALLVLSLAFSVWIPFLSKRWMRCILVVTAVFSASAILETASLLVLGGPLSSAAWEAVFATNAREALEFASGFWPILLVALLAGALQIAIALRFIPAMPPRKSLRAAILLFATATFMGFLSWDALFVWKALPPPQRASAMLNLQASRLEKTQPWGTLLKISRAWYGHKMESATAQALSHLRSGAHRITPSPAEGIAIVLVVGESSRASSWGIFGGTENSTPHLAHRPGIVTVPLAIAPANTTGRVLPMILGTSSPADPERADRELPWISAFQELGFETWWISNQPIGDPSDGLFAAWAAGCDHLVRGSMDYDHPGTRDADLLPAVSRSLKNSRRDILIIFHTMGSHWRYPLRHAPEDASFRPSLSQGCGSEAFLPGRERLLRNSYLNTIAATDRLLDSAISLLQESSRATLLAYVSDHGENLDDDKRHLFLHGTPFPSFQEVHVPMLFWANAKARELFAKRSIDLSPPRTPISTRDLFPTLFQLAGISVPGCDSSRSLFAKIRHGSPVQVLAPSGEILELPQIH